MQSERILSLRWDKFISHVAGSLDACYEKQQFVDVSLVCKDGTILKCHKIILANASTFFCHLLAANDHPHPMIILHDIDADDLKTIINFIYCGEIQVVESEVRRILKIANILQISGLTDIQTKPVAPSTEPRTYEVNSKVMEGITNVPSPVRHLPIRSVKIPPDTNKKYSLRKLEAPMKVTNNMPECGKVMDDRRRFGPYDGSTETIRPGTSKSPQITITRKKRESETILDWNHVLKSIAKNDQLPLKKLCIMNEVEITPGKLPSDNNLYREQTYLEKRGRSITDPSSDFEVIVIRDDADIPYDVHESNM